MEYREVIKSVAPAPGLTLVFAMVAVYAETIYHLPISNSLLFALAVFFVFYVPGDLMLNVSRIELPFAGSRFILSTALGLIVVSIGYSLWRHLEVQSIFLYLPFIGSFILWLWLKKSGRNNSSLQSISNTDLYSIIILISIILILLKYTHFTDALLTVDGFDIRFSSSTETVFHQGMINSLIDSYPLKSLYASDITSYSHYHIGMHLHIELLHRLFNIPTIQLIYYYFAFFYFFLLSALSYSVARSIGGNWISALLAGILIYGSDFSYMIGIVNSFKASTEWASVEWDLLNLLGVFSIFTYNGIIPGLISLLFSILLFNQYCKLFSINTAVVLAAVVISAYLFKYTLGLQLNLAIIGVAVLMSATPLRKKSGLVLVGIFSLLITVMLGYQYGVSGGTGNSVVKFAPFNMFLANLEINGLQDTAFYLKPLVFIMYFILALGARYLGYHILIKTSWNMKESGWSVGFIFIFFLLGYSLSEFLFIGVEGGYDNSKWFAVQSMFAAWVFVFYFIVKMEGGLKRHLISIAVVMVLVFPSTIQLLAVRGTDYIKFDNDDMVVIDFIKNTKPDSIFLHPIEPLEPSLAANFGGRSSVLTDYFSFITPFLIDGVNEENVKNRFTDVKHFFSDTIAAKRQSEILEKYRANYVYCRNSLSACSSLESHRDMTLVLRNKKNSVYSVSRRTAL